MSKQALVIAGIYLLAFGCVVGSNLSPVVLTATSFKRPWVKSGQLMAFSPGKDNDKFYLNPVYRDANGNSWPIIGSTWNVVRMVKCEFPDGIETSFVSNGLLEALNQFGVCETLVSSSQVADEIIDGIARVESDEESKKRLKELLSGPTFNITDNSWAVEYMTVATGDAVRIKLFTGTLRPFSVKTEVTENLIECNSQRPWGEVLKESIARKIAVYAQWEKWPRGQAMPEPKR